MIVVFETASGSRYEVDQGQKQIRRLSGAKDPQPRQGADGEWRVYRAISPVVNGEPVFIYWPDGTALLPGSPPEAKPATMTSAVVRSAVRL